MGGTDVDARLETLVAALRIGLLALGFEAPLVHTDP